MTARELIDVLLPAYAPCEGFSGSCASACIWAPERGIVPCAFGGALGALDEVQLVIVTAEPSDPPDDGAYHGTPREMVAQSLSIFERSIRSGDLGRSGRPTAFHRRMRFVLDLFWPDIGLDVQLRRTWTTNAVLCPASVTTGAHPRRVEQACAARFLAPQLALLPQAFVVALGDKAERRMRQAGLPIDATGPHPSSRLPAAEQEARWRRAADRFRCSRAGSPVPAPAAPHTDQAASSRAARPNAASPPSNAVRARETASADDLDEAIGALPLAAAEFFRAVREHPDYNCVALRMQMTVHFRGAKVGGLNRKISEWYVSKVFVRNNGGPAPLERRGFRHVVKDQHHDYWALKGPGATEAFQDAIAEMTGVDI